MLAPAGKALVEAAGFGLADSDSNFDARRAQALHAVAGDGGIGIDGGGDDAREPGGDQRLGAGAGAAGVVAGLQGDVGRAAAQTLAGVLLRRL